MITPTTDEECSGIACYQCEYYLENCTVKRSGCFTGGKVFAGRDNCKHRIEFLRKAIGWL